MWEVSDRLWERVAFILDRKDPKLSRGRPRGDRRKIVDAVIFKARTGCQWNLIPKVYGSDTTIHRSFQRWLGLGIWEDIVGVLAEDFPELAGFDWKSQARSEPKEGRPQ